jgi:hypothetical protein
VYAWAVGWEVYWLNMLPVITPPPLPTARPTYSISSQKNTEVKILCSMANTSSSGRPTVLYANQGTHAPSTGGQYRTRFIGGIAEPIDGYEFDITANLAQIKPLVAGESWWLECFQCGDGSGVTRLTTPLKIVVTAS